MLDTDRERSVAKTGPTSLVSVPQEWGRLAPTGAGFWKVWQPPRTGRMRSVVDDDAQAKAMNDKRAHHGHIPSKKNSRIGRQDQGLLRPGL